MICPKCKSKSKVYNSRPTDDGTIRRNRECFKCSHRYATIEVLVDRKKKADLETQVVAKPAQPKKVAVTTRRKQRKRRFSYSAMDRMTDDELMDALEKGWIHPDDLDD